MKYRVQNTRTLTPAIKGDNSISELRKVNIGDTELVQRIFNR